jgi:gas vesicle protein
MNESCNSKTSALPMFLAGLGTGVAFALLLAPLSGEAARNLIGRKVQEGETWVKDQKDEAQGFVRNQSAALRDKVSAVADLVRS